MTGLDAALLVTLGAAVGAPLRYLTMHALRLRLGATPAAGTLVVNVAGSLVLGVLAGAAVTGEWLALLGVGLCGSLTTFSTLALQVWDAATDRRTVHAVADLVLSLVLGLLAATAGWLLGAALR